MLGFWASLRVKLLRLALHMEVAAHLLGIQDGGGLGEELMFAKHISDLQ